MKKLQTSIWPLLSQNAGIWTVVYSVIRNKALQYVPSIYSSKKLKRKLQNLKCQQRELQKLLGLTLFMTTTSPYAVKK